MEKSTNINFTATRTIITYDLENNDISANEIAAESNGAFETTIAMTNGNVYSLPNTTLHTTVYDKDRAISLFQQCFNLAKRKKMFSRAKIKNIFACEILGKSGYIKNS